MSGMLDQKTALLSDTVIKEIEHWLAKFPADHRQSALLAALTAAQNANAGWLSKELIDAVADYIGVPRIAAHEAATFYSMYELKPVGKHKICVCTNISCLLRGSENVVKHLEERLGIKLGETTADGKFTLKNVECLAACGGAPAIQIGNDYHENITPVKLEAILKGLE